MLPKWKAVNCPDNLLVLKNQMDGHLVGQVAETKWPKKSLGYNYKSVKLS